MAKKSAPSRVHVTPNPAGGWKVVPASKKSAGTFPTQQDAQNVGRKILQNGSGGELTTHGRDNLIRESDTIAPAKDPFPPRG